MLAYYDPYASMQLDAEVFPSFSIGQVKMLPVCLPDERGRPRFSLESGEAIPYLSYTQGAFLGRSVRMLLKNDPLRMRLRTVYETAMAEAQGHGHAGRRHGLDTGFLHSPGAQ